MNKIYLYSLLFFFGLIPLAFTQESTKIFLLTKDEYKFLESNNKLIPQAIKNAFGDPVKQNPYKIDIKQIDCWNKEAKEFKYNTDKSEDPSRTAFASKILAAKENIDLHLRVTLNKEKSSYNDALAPYISSKGIFTLNIVVIGDARVFIKETKDKDDFLQIIDEKGFADKAFSTFFGDPKKMNYNIAYDKLNACFVKDILEPQCNEKLELIGDGNKYDDFSNKITSSEYSSKWIIFNVGISRTRSKLNESIEKSIFKMKSGSEYIKFYFVIPKDNLRARKLTVEGKIVNPDRKPVKDLNVYLRDASNQVIATQKTDDEGAYKFEKLNEGYNYNLYIDNSCKEKALYIMTKSNIVIAEFKHSDIGFEYKLLPADISRLASITETDPEMDFIATIKGKMLKVSEKIGSIAEQVIEIKDKYNQVLQSQKTDNQGNFEFKNVNPYAAYAFDLPGYVPADKDEKVYMSNIAGEFITEFRAGENNLFHYKLLPADVSRLRYMNEEDVSLEFNSQTRNATNQIIIREMIYYESGSAEVSKESIPVIDKIAKLMTDNKEYKLEIVSHTDSRGTDADNQKLSLKRSESVAKYLASKSVDNARLKPSGMGESNPLNNCLDGKKCLEEEYRMNRRTEFKFIKEAKRP